MQILVDKVVGELTAVDQTLKNSIGFTSDGAASMVGGENSVWPRLKNTSPNCLQMKCICHYLNLCIEHAFSKLPSDIRFLLTEVPLWFSNSAIRTEYFKAL